jgi:hypothetical protein
MAMGGCAAYQFPAQRSLNHHATRPGPRVESRYVVTNTTFFGLPTNLPTYISLCINTNTPFAYHT